MQQLQRNFTAVTMNRFCYHLVRFGMFGFTKFGTEWVQAPTQIGRETTGHDKPNATFGALFVKGSEFVESFLVFFKTGMHRSHQDAVAQLSES
ncbi:hypothetical protein VFA_002056 [Vibrio furnissii CIP 102972]|nr:hypothetical protein VFA_002056 [Vibrio furnissii CIP 102972]